MPKHETQVEFKAEELAAAIEAKETEVAAVKAKKPAKEKTVVTEVTMEDGRKVGFAGKRRMLKTTSHTDGHAKVRFDFVNGKTIDFTVPHAMMAQFAAHGASQKIGDEVSGEDNLDDAVLGVEAIVARLNSGEWGAERTAGDGFGGASLVIRAICEANGKDAETVKAFLQKKLDTAKEKGEKLSRQDLYASFRKPGSKTGVIIARLEAEKAAKVVAKGPSADELLAEMN